MAKSLVLKSMMLNLNTRYTRPVITVNYGISCLIDTGADTPVWTRGAVALESLFKTKHVDEKKFLLSGFGKKPEIADVYENF